MRIHTLILALSVLLANGTQAGEQQMHVYHIGNSLTASLTLDRLHKLFAERGIDYQFGSQLSGGKSLIRHKNFRDEPGQKWVTWETMVPVGETFDPDPNPYNKQPGERFGYWETALTEHSWDAVVFQLYGSSLHDDLLAISHFIDLALEHDAASSFYVYSTWPRRMRKKGPDGKALKEARNIDYPAAWTKPYDFTAEDTVKQASWGTPRRDYTAKLLSALNEKYAQLETPIRLIPAGEVLFALDGKIKNDALPGLEELAERRPDLVPGKDEDTDFSDGINVLYADGIHLNPMPHKNDTLGIYVSGTTVFTVLSGQNPVGMSGAPYGLDAPENEALLRAVQETIWEIVTSDPRTGVTP